MFEWDTFWTTSLNKHTHILQSGESVLKINHCVLLFLFFIDVQYFLLLL